MAKFDLDKYKESLIKWQNQKNIGVVYLIENLINNKIYIGQTTQSMEKRFGQHFAHQRSIISRSMRKYGKKNFIILELAKAKTIEELNHKEIEYIDFYCSLVPNGYNVLRGGLNAINRIPWNKGTKGAQVAWNKGKNGPSGRYFKGEHIQTGEILILYTSSRDKRFNSGHIIQCCKGNLRQHKGYRWSYYDKRKSNEKV